MTVSVYYCGYTSMTLCEPTVQHFLLLAHWYSHRKGSISLSQSDIRLFKDINSSIGDT